MLPTTPFGCSRSHSVRCLGERRMKALRGLPGVDPARIAETSLTRRSTDVSKAARSRIGAGRIRICDQEDPYAGEAGIR